jgi:hypothetical protein
MMVPHGNADDSRRQKLRMATRSRCECPLETGIDTDCAMDCNAGARTRAGAAIVTGPAA